MSPPAVAGSASFGRYRLLERIGAGGMANVYRARTDGPDGTAREVVIKRVLPELSRHPEFSSMLVAEARLSARLSHPNIVEIYELGRVGDEYFVAMELVDGVDLVRLLNRCIRAERPLPVGSGCLVVTELARALAYAHDLCDTEGRPLSIVHRDVTPSNVMVTRTGGIKLLDFGVAKAAEHIRDERTRTGTLRGKVNYLSPEIADGLPADRRADIFALGIVLHECLTLKRLFKAEGDLQTLRLIRDAKVAPPSTVRPDVPPELDRVVLKMLARDPEARYADCNQLLADLSPITAALGGDAAALARLVAEVPAGEGVPSPVEGMDSGPTPAIEIQNLAANTPSRSLELPAPKRPRWLRTSMVAAVAVPALAMTLFIGRHGTPAPVAPSPAPAAPSPAPVAPPVPEPALLVIDTDVKAARIELDGKVVADQVRNARIPVAQPGEHELTVTAPRRRPYARKLTTSAGATIELHVKLARTHAQPQSEKRVRDENYLVDPFGK